LKPGEETIGGVAFIGQGSPVKQGDEDDGNSLKKGDVKKGDEEEIRCQEGR
jgi:hypothetical protein